MGDVSVSVGSGGAVSVAAAAQYPIGTKSNINETSHGISVNEVVTYKSSTWQAFTTGDTALGICVKVIDANNFTLLTGGFTNLVTGLTANTLYYAQSDGSMGTTVTAAPIFYAISATEGYLLFTPEVDLKDIYVPTITDGATPSLDCLNYKQVKAEWSTAQSTPTLSLSNVGELVHLVIEKTIAGDTVVTLSATGFKFVDLDSDNDTVAATVDITLSGANPSYYEISILKTPFTDTDTILHVTSKL